LLGATTDFELVPAYWYTNMSGGMPVRCFTCGKIVGNMYEDYVERCKTVESAAVLDDLKLSRACCRRMLATHVDVTKYQLMYPVYEDGIQRLGTSKYDVPAGTLLEQDEIDLDPWPGARGTPKVIKKTIAKSKAKAKIIRKKPPTEIILE